MQLTVNSTRGTIWSNYGQKPQFLVMCVYIRTFYCIYMHLELFGTVTVLFLIAVGQWRHHTNHPGLASFYKLLQSDINFY